MQVFRGHWVGIDHGEVTLFSDFEDDGPMWTETGPREVRNTVFFSKVYTSPPVVMVNLTMWDIQRGANSRVEIAATGITPEKFTILFKTWSDTRIARARAAWQAIGQMNDDDQWEV